jgi:hypothetical protein
MRKTIVEFELFDHGIHRNQYFQGCGTSYTEFTDCATGIGSNFAEALDDCLESLAQQDWETDGMEKRILAEYFPRKRKLPVKPAVNSRMNEDCYYYVSMRVKGPDPIFTVIEYSSFFAVRHTPTGDEMPMGDGVDTLFDADGKALSPGSPGFVELWTKLLNESEGETYDAYFPELVADYYA